MKALRLAVLALARDAKSGELGVLLLALLVAVSALTAVGFFTSRVSRAVDQQAGEVLAADLRLQSPNPIDREYFQEAAAAGLKTAELATFPSVVLIGEESALTAIRAVSEGYPLRGRVKVAAAPFQPGYEVDSIPGPREAWPEARLLAQLGAKVGDRLSIGNIELTVTRVLDYRPDQGSAFVDLAPTMLMRLEDLPATGLIQPGSRVSYAALFAGEVTAIAALKQQLAARKKPSERLVDLQEASRQERLSNHLKSDDFFSVEKFPEAKLAITGSKPGKGGQIEVTGNLTIKGITKLVTFPATIKNQGNGLEAEGTITVDRILYDIKYRSKSVLDPSALADRLIYDEFTLEFKLTASK